MVQVRTKEEQHEHKSRNNEDILHGIIIQDVEGVSMTVSLGWSELLSARLDLSLSLERRSIHSVRKSSFCSYR